MNGVLKLAGILLAAGVIYIRQPDLYTALCAGLSVLLVLGLWLMVRSRTQSRPSRRASTTATYTARRTHVSTEPRGRAVIVGVVLGILTFLTASSLAWVGSRTPMYGMFYDQDVASFNSLVQAYEDDANYTDGVHRLDERLSKPISQTEAKRLAIWKLELLIKHGDSQVNQPSAQVGTYRNALSWAEEWKLEIGEAQAKLDLAEKLAQPTSTPEPTQTPQPTLAPLPTHTPQPTEDLSGLYTCTGPELLEEQNPYNGETLRLYRCNESDLYRIDWYQAGSLFAYSLPVKVDSDMGAEWVPSYRGSFTVYAVTDPNTGKVYMVVQDDP